ncbi:unnamed protein product [Boreogadus saida]
MDNCDGPLVSTLPDASFHSSSQSSVGNAPQFAKLNRREATDWVNATRDNCCKDREKLELIKGTGTAQVQVPNAGRPIKSLHTEDISDHAPLFSDNDENVGILQLSCKGSRTPRARTDREPTPDLRHTAVRGPMEGQPSRAEARDERLPPQTSARGDAHEGRKCDPPSARIAHP